MYNKLNKIIVKIKEHIFYGYYGFVCKFPNLLRVALYFKLRVYQDIPESQYT